MATSQRTRTRQQDPAGEASDWRSRYDRFGPAVCPICWGMGWMRYDVEYGKPHFGELVKCPRDHAASDKISLAPNDSGYETPDGY